MIVLMVTCLVDSLDMNVRIILQHIATHCNNAIPFLMDSLDRR